MIPLSPLLTLLVTVAFLVLFFAVRFVYLRASSGSSVDHYYWILAARAYRKRAGLPVSLPHKFLLENERQAYPPWFAILLASLPDAFIAGKQSIVIILTLDLLTFGLLVCVAAFYEFSFAGYAATFLTFAFAPVLVAYNTQLTSRGLGNLFLVLALLSQVGAASSTGMLAVALAILGICALSAMILTHKMTTQLYLFLWPAWPFALAPLGPHGALIGALSPLAALAVCMDITGIRFQQLQWRAHWDIVSFWARNWRFLGAHQFRQSPLYGDTTRKPLTSFHGAGLSGVIRHAALIFAYLPSALLLPITLFVAPAPPAFVVLWLTTAYGAALATLYLPTLRCLGGGHLYIFNAVAPAALWWGFVLSGNKPSSLPFFLFVVSLILTATSLAGGLRRRMANTPINEKDIEALIERLRSEPATRVAAFPVTLTERIALDTDHSVFWGGHGLGFRTLEPYWPVMREPIGKALRRWDVTHAILDLDWWPEGRRIFTAETGDNSPEYFGKLALYRMAKC